MPDSTTYTHCTVRELAEAGGRCAWQPGGAERILFDRPGSDGFFDIWRIESDGSGPINLTNGHGSLPGFHCGNPAWHPALTHFAFIAQAQDLALDSVANPGAGVHNDVYVYRLSDLSVTRVYESPDPGDASVPGSLAPHFNHDGTKLCWVRKIGDATAESFSGIWDIMVADFTDTGTPAIANAVSYQPGPAGGAIVQQCFHETHGFNSDGTKILYTANPTNTQDQFYMDLFEVTLGNAPNGTARTRLTLTSGLIGEDATWDEHGHYSKDGLSILWGKSDTPTPTPLTGDWWIMDVDGSNARQLTYFGTPGHRHYAAYGGRGLYAADGDFSPDGSEWVGLLRDNAQGQGEGPLVKIAFGTATSPARFALDATRAAAASRAAAGARTASSGRVAC